MFCTVLLVCINLQRQNLIGRWSRSSGQATLLELSILSLKRLVAENFYVRLDKHNHSHLDFEIDCLRIFWLRADIDVDSRIGLKHLIVEQQH